MGLPVSSVPVIVTGSTLLWSEIFILSSFGRSPFVYFDLSWFIFQLPASELSASRMPAGKISVKAYFKIRMFKPSIRLVSVDCNFIPSGVRSALLFRWLADGLVAEQTDVRRKRSVDGNCRWID